MAAEKQLITQIDVEASKTKPLKNQITYKLTTSIVYNNFLEWPDNDSMWTRRYVVYGYREKEEKKD